MKRIVRCQCAILQEGRILLLRHVNPRHGNSYWWLPGGGPEAGESFEQAARRETLEETNLLVRIERLLFELEDPLQKHEYRRYLTFLATPVGGELAVGFDGAASGPNRLQEARWVPLRDESVWEPGFYEDHLLELLRRTQQETSG